MAKKLLAILLVGLMGVFLLPMAVGATNPTVTITVSATVIAITNSQDTWVIGPVEVDNVKYFSADNLQDDTYSQINNTGNVAVDVQIQGTNITGTYNWTLNTTAGDKIYSLMANSEAAPATYDVEVKYSSYNNLTTNLTAADQYDWSLKFIAPSAFDAADDGTNKTAVITLVASKYGA